MASHSDEITLTDEVRKCTEVLYSEIDSVISDLVSSRLRGDKRSEELALSSMESLMVKVQQHLSLFI